MVVGWLVVVIIDGDGVVNHGGEWWVGGWLVMVVS